MFNLKWLSIKQGQCLLYNGNEEWEITLLFQAQMGSLRSPFPFAFFQSSIPTFFPSCPYEILLKSVAKYLFSKSFIVITQISGSDFHIQVWRPFCALCKLPWATVYAKGWWWNVLHIGQRNDFENMAFKYKHNSVKQLIQHFLCMKERKGYDFFYEIICQIFTHVYKPSMQVGSMFGYPLVQIESWQAGWKLLPTLCIINWIKGGEGGKRAL